MNQLIVFGVQRETLRSNARIVLKSELSSLKADTILLPEIRHRFLVVQGTETNDGYNWIMVVSKDSYLGRKDKIKFSHRDGFKELERMSFNNFFEWVNAYYSFEF